MAQPLTWSRALTASSNCFMLMHAATLCRHSLSSAHPHLCIALYCNDQQLVGCHVRTSHEQWMLTVLPSLDPSFLPQDTAVCSKGVWGSWHACMLSAATGAVTFS